MSTYVGQQGSSLVVLSLAARQAIILWAVAGLSIKAWGVHKTQMHAD